MYSYYKTLESEMIDRQHNDQRIKELNDRASEVRNKSKELINSSKSMSGKNIHSNASNNALQAINKSKNVAYKRLENRGNRATDSYYERGNHMYSYYNALESACNKFRNESNKL